MELHQLRYVAAVARTGNFSRAADECHVSQPSLSQQIQKLEHELGERLFDRLKRETKLTVHGEAFLHRALKILEEVDTATREAKDAKELLRGTVNLGILPTIAPYLLPQAMAKFTKKFPGVELIVHEDTTERLLKLMLACEIDIALASCPVRDERLEVHEMFIEELLLALPPRHPLTLKRTLCAKDLEGERLIVMKQGHCLAIRSSASVTAKKCGPPSVSAVPSLKPCNASFTLDWESLLFRHGRTTRGVYHTGISFFSSTATHSQIVAVWPKQRTRGRAAAEFLNTIRQGAVPGRKQ